MKDLSNFRLLRNFDVGVLVFSAAAIFLASVHGKCLRYTKDVDVVFTKKNSSLLTLERGR